MPEQTTNRNGSNYGPSQTPTVGGSPWTFVNPENVPILATVSGGTVLSISMASDLLGLINLGLLGGSWHLNPGQSLVITYVLAPTLTYWPI